MIHVMAHASEFLLRLVVLSQIVRHRIRVLQASSTAIFFADY